MNQHQQSQPRFAPAADWIPQYSRWRHGGWYVNNVRYPSGACGVVSNNYPDRKWRIACDKRRVAIGEAGDFTFVSRDAAARAEYELAEEEHARVPAWIRDIGDVKLKYSAHHLIRCIDKDPQRSLAELVQGVLCIRPVDGKRLEEIGTRYLAERFL
ncbi:hypothetical protein [Burkholderia sp. Ac-20365]|uniref:hypothetical protein n=1 Tax=Burkholderia sp. Ac-20365 TaxID=2703897 RepID=UPI001F11CFDB|nr:hypothetical protein [Burkholderia sp. Ac-20365]